MANYKCPKCGAPIVFKPEIGGFKCDYCYSSFSEAELTSAVENASKGVSETTQAPSGMQGYQCGNCGAEVVVGDTSHTAFCFYCHSPIVIGDRLKNEFKPDLIIPFKIDKKTAIQKFLNWAKGKKYTPNDFTSTMQQEKMTGVYLPYWFANYDAHVDYTAEGIEQRTWTSGRKEYTETKTYQIKRSGSVELENINALAFDKIDSNLINAVGKFDLDEIQKFSPGYLAGFFSEQYNKNAEEIVPMLDEKAHQEIKYQIAASCQYSRVRNEVNNSTIQRTALRYTLLPTWVLSYIYKGKPYVFAVNGQTGDVMGEAPLSTAKIAVSSVIKGLVLAGLLILGGMFLW